MGRRDKLPGDQEPDYLAGAQLAVDPDSFSNTVREAYTAEYGVSQLNEIAEIVGRDKSRITQVFKNPEKLDLTTIRSLLEPLSGMVAKQRIVSVWIREALGVEVRPSQYRGLAARAPTAKTMLRVDRYIREMRLLFAATLAKQGAARTKDVVLREQFRDRGYFALQRIDYVGQAMVICREIAEDARGRREPLREALGYALAFRALLGLPDSKPDEVERLLRKAENLVATAWPPQELPNYRIATPALLSSLALSAHLKWIERGFIDPNPTYLREQLALQLAEAKRRTKDGNHRRFLAYQKAAAIHLLLGETFQADECIEQAFRSGELQNLNALEMCGILKSRVIRQTEGAASASKYLRQVSENSMDNQDMYHARMAEYDRARLEVELMG